MGATRAFQDASGKPTNWILRGAAVIPLLGRTPDTLLTLSDIGRDVSEAGAAVMARIDGLPGPGGLASLGPEQGRLPVDRLSSLAPVVHRARVVLDRAGARAARLPRSLLFGSVAEARDLVASRLDQVNGVARGADALLGVLPQLTGSDDRARTYFVAPQNLTEERATGGVIGNYGLLGMRDGLIDVGPFSNIGELPTLPPTKVRSPSPEYSRLYDSFGGAGFWLNLNMTPHAPLAGTLIENLYQSVTGRRIDGTIFVDLAALARMLQATGPVAVPRLDATLTSATLVPFIAQARYLGDFPNAETIGPRLIAEAILDRFFGSAPAEEALLALVDAATEGHLIVHAREPAVQAAIEAAGLSGTFRYGGGDFFGLVGSNAAGNKVDYYLQRKVQYDVHLQPDGAARARIRVSFTNLVPAGARPSYTLGPYPGLPLEPGENQAWTSFYSAPRTRLARATRDGRPLSLRYYRELGLGRLSSFVRIKPEQSTEMDVDLAMTGAWSGDHAAGTYRLHLQGPPTVRPTPVTVTVTSPAGMEVVRTTEPMDVRSGRATWRGTLSGSMDLEVSFAQPLPRRILTRVWDFLSRPVFEV